MLAFLGILPVRDPILCRCSNALLRRPLRRATASFVLRTYRRAPNLPPRPRRRRLAEAHPAHFLRTSPHLLALCSIRLARRPIPRRTAPRPLLRRETTEATPPLAGSLRHTRGWHGADLLRRDSPAAPDPTPRRTVPIVRRSARKTAAPPSSLLSPLYYRRWQRQRRRRRQQRPQRRSPPQPSVDSARPTKSFRCKLLRRGSCTEGSPPRVSSSGSRPRRIPTPPLPPPRPKVPAHGAEGSRRRPRMESGRLRRRSSYRRRRRRPRPRPRPSSSPLLGRPRPSRPRRPAGRPARPASRRSPGGRRGPPPPTRCPRHFPPSPCWRPIPERPPRRFPRESHQHRRRRIRS
mmetsp:Transcript_14247/g.26998  ORF Transcript_14247/g.26998 Transcript_14247/m.26998 type:complete len:348 (-) Transcript_14247:939-1982(-)